MDAAMFITLEAKLQHLTSYTGVATFLLLLFPEAVMLGNGCTKKVIQIGLSDQSYRSGGFDPSLSTIHFPDVESGLV
jgi:hypothetical protein